MFNRMKLKPYLLTIFSALIALTGVLALVSVLGLLNAQHEADKLVNEILASNSAVKECRIQLNLAAQELRELVLSEDSQQISSYESDINDSLQSIEEQLQIFKDTHGTADGMAQKYETAFNSWSSIATRALEAAKQGNWESAKDILLTECSPALSELADIAREIDSMTSEARQEQEDHTLFMIQLCIVLTVVLFLAALILGLTVALRSTSMMTGAVKEILKAVEGLAAGKLHSHANYEGNNEFGELAERLNLSFQELSKYMDAIDYGMSEFSKGNFTCECPLPFIGDFANIQRAIEDFQEKIRSLLVDLSSASTQVSSGADQVADGAQALAQGATEQASSVEELSAAISDISDRISDTAQFSHKADQLGQEAREIVEKGKDEMRQLLSSIRDIAEASNNIQSIIKVIDDIAFQTNILALNAAVEAARAGNAGKGFAVVADEVRSLAQKSADAAQETTSLIKNSLQHVAHGEEIAKRTDTAFNEVADSAENILTMIAKIAAASNEQASSISEISVGIDQISAVVQTNSATSEESAAASQELSGQANLMQEKLSRFRLHKYSSGGSGNSSSCMDQSMDMPEMMDAEPTEHMAPVSVGIGDKY